MKILKEGALLTLNAKTGWREVEIGRGSKEQTCPVHALEQWLHFAKIDFGPIFVALAFGLTVLTILTRGFFFISSKPWSLPHWAQRGLQYAPIAALSAVVPPLPGRALPQRPAPN